jgi:hypothetical protein
MEKALSAFSAGRVIQPVRNMLTIEEAKRFLGIMPAVTEEGMGAKLVCFFPKNAASSLPTHLAMIMLFRPDNGPAAGFHGWATHHGYANRCRLRRCNEASCITGMQDPCAARERRSGTRTFAGPSPCVSVRQSARVMSVTSLLCVRAPSTVRDRSTVIAVARRGSLTNGCMLRRLACCSQGRLAARSTAFSLRY